MDAKGKVIETLISGTSDNDGQMSRQQCSEIIHEIIPGWPEEDVSTLLDAAPVSAEGSIQCNEFIEWLWGMAKLAEEAAVHEKDKLLKAPARTRTLNLKYSNMKKAVRKVKSLGRANQAFHCHFHHGERDPDEHNADGYGSVSESSESDSEIKCDDVVPFQVKRRGGQTCTKFGPWNRRIIGFFQVPKIEKSKDHYQILSLALKYDQIFRPAVERNLVESVVNAFEVFTPPPQSILADIGLPAEALYVVLEGIVEVSIFTQGMIVAQEVLGPGDHFGDESLLWHTTWTIKAVAREGCVLGKMERSLYTNAVVVKGMQEAERRSGCLHLCKSLETFDDEQIAKIAEVMTSRVYQQGDIITRKNEPGHHFFILESGECSVFLEGLDGEPQQWMMPGTLFGERALTERHKRDCTIRAESQVEVLCLNRKKFQRLFGSLDQVKQNHTLADPRHVIAQFYKEGTKAGPSGVLDDDEINNEESTRWFAVFRPTSRDAISKLISGQGVGKGLNVKGKSAKKGILSGYVPFLQISENKHKASIESSPANSWIKLFFRTEHSREEGIRALMQILETNRQDIPLENPNATVHEVMRLLNRYKPLSFGVLMPEVLLRHAYIDLKDLTPHAGWETGRKSEPFYMNMNLRSMREHTRNQPEIVLWQLDEAHPMNPHGLLIAYEEEFAVKPIVSDFDPFLVGSCGMLYPPLPEEQVEMAKWCLDCTAEILEKPSLASWTERWLDALAREKENGAEPHTIPEFGYGDDTSIALVRQIVQALKLSGALRHGAECFNYHFPQPLDEEFLIIWDGFPEQPWRYLSEKDIRQFLMLRAKEGYAFPLNPVWPVRDPGWYEVLQALLASEEAVQPLEAWFPEESGLLETIDDLYERFPLGFQPGMPTSPDLEKRRKTARLKARISILEKSSAIDIGTTSMKLDRRATELHHQRVKDLDRRTTDSPQPRKVRWGEITSVTRGLSGLIHGKVRADSEKSDGSALHAFASEPLPAGL